MILSRSADFWSAAETTSWFNGVKYPKSWYEGLAARMRGARRRTGRLCRSSPRVKAVSADASDGRTLSLARDGRRGLGRQEQAVQEAEQACDLEAVRDFYKTRRCALHFRRLCLERSTGSCVSTLDS